MGISGLLPLLKEASRAAHVRDHAGKTFAVDGASARRRVTELTLAAYVWLHRAISSCAQELATGQHRAAAPRYVNYAMERIRMLRHFGVEPYVVFDGGPLPSKRGTEEERAKKRSEALAQATACVAEGNASLARDWYLKAVDVTPQMAFQFIKALQAVDVAFVVAPYEADAQLAYLEREGIVDGVITEDSDLLVFGCKTVLYKLDQAGSCVEVKRDRFTACRDYNMNGWTDAEFRHMAILSGCDYADSITGIGLKMAYKLIKRYKSWVKAVQFVRLDGKLTVPSSYERDFRRAEVTFLHQVVYDPRSQKAVHCTPLPASGLTDEHLDAVGELMEAKLARGMARGEICPCSRKPMVDIVPSDSTASPQAGPSKAKQGKATELAPVTVRNRIDGYFLPRASTPSVKPGSTSKRIVKRPALDELNRNTKRTATMPSLGAPVKSKFFGSSSKSAPVIMSAPIDVDADDDEAEMDIEAFLRDVEPPPRSDAVDDDDALDALRELEAIGATEMVPTSDPVSPPRIVKTETRVKVEDYAVMHGGSDISSPRTTPKRSRAPVAPQSTGNAKVLSEMSISSPPAAFISPLVKHSQVSTFKTSPVSDSPTPDERASIEWHQRFSFTGSAHGASSSTSASSHRPIPAAPSRPPLSPVRASAKRSSALTRLDSFRYRP